MVAWGSGSVIVKKVDMGGIAVSAWRFGLFAVAALLVRAIRRQTIPLSAFRASLAGGIYLALDVAFFFSAVKLTTVVNATVIGALQPLVVTAYAWRFMGERVQRRDMLLGLLALAGVIVVVMGASETEPGDWRGDLLAVGALFMWAGYFVESKKARDRVNPSDFTLATASIVVVTMAPLSWMLGQEAYPPGGMDWVWLVVMAIGSGVIGHNLMNWSLVRIPLWLGSTFTLLIPPTAALIAWIWLGESLNAIQVMAILVVLATLGLLVRGQTGR